MGKLVDGRLVERPRRVEGRPGRQHDEVAFLVVRERARRRGATVIGAVAAEADVGSGRGDQLLGGLEVGLGIGLALVLVHLERLAAPSTWSALKTVKVFRMKNRSSRPRRRSGRPTTVLVERLPEDHPAAPVPLLDVLGALADAAAEALATGERPPPPGRRPRRRAWSSSRSGFTPWYGFREATLECRPGWEHAGSPAMVAARAGGRLEGRDDLVR